MAIYNSFCDNRETVPVIDTVIGEVNADASDEVDSSVPQTIFPKASVSNKLAPEQPVTLANCILPPVKVKPLLMVEVVVP